MLRRQYRNTPASARKNVFGLYPVTTVDVAYPGYKSTGWESSGTKDRATETKLFSAFQEQFRESLKQAGISFDKETLLVQIHTVRGRIITEEFLLKFKEALNKYLPLKGYVLINLDAEAIWPKGYECAVKNRK